MTRLLLALIVGLSLASLPLRANAADGDKRGLLLRVNGDVSVARGESVNTVIVIEGDAVIDGAVRDSLLVVHGTATITGTVKGSVTVINGDLVLRRGSTVEDVNLVRSVLTRDDGANVTGNINHRQNFVFRGAWAIFSVLFWAGMTIAVLASGLLFAAIGGRQLTSAARALTEETVNSIIGAVFFWIAVPIVAIVLFLTVVGIPLGLGLLLFFLPAGWFLGYIVAGARLGGAIAGLTPKAAGEHPYAATAVGLLLLQLVAVIPGLGWLIVGLAGLWGAGSLAFLAFRAVRGGPEAPSSAVEAATPATPV